MTVIPFAAAVCHDCKAPVAIVRRRVAFVCSSHGGVCHAREWRPTPVEADGTKHMCHAASERPFGSWYDASDGSSVASSDTIGNGRVSARPRSAAVPCLEV